MAAGAAVVAMADLGEDIGGLSGSGGRGRKRGGRLRGMLQG